ncbi:MBL fold metallo-hydrolase [Acholeplasma granularum]|uniref:MBL fold metallo-hydrolase n=1 Tax=Acholeplasma granularum TaxID=264635 RepID=UPI000A05E1E5|nr:MBL fold metallo-hydrolase [Acholeplasma granularum]
MLYTFNGSEDIAHSYLICRFGHCLLIDPSYDYESIMMKLGDQILDGILLTHAHSDHAGLIHLFNVPIYINEMDVALLFEDKYNGFSKENPRPYKRKDLQFKFVNDLDKIPLADQEVICYHTPGHTKGSLSFLFQKYLFTGDTLFKGSVGRHDLYSGNLFDLKRSILRLIDEIDSNVMIKPGHDEESTVRIERKMNPFYIKWKKQGKI